MTVEHISATTAMALDITTDAPFAPVVPATGHLATWLQTTYDRYRARALTHDESIRNAARHCSTRPAIVIATIEPH